MSHHKGNYITLLVFIRRNAGIIGGKFMERTRVLRPGSSLSDPSGPLYYDLTDLYVGTKIEVLSHHFVLIDADEYVYNYMEADPSRFNFSNPFMIKYKITKLLQSLSEQEKGSLKDKLRKADPNNSGLVDRNFIVSLTKSQFPGLLSDHEIITFSRLFEDVVRKPNYVKLLSSI